VNRYSWGLSAAANYAWETNFPHEYVKKKGPTGGDAGGKRRGGVRDGGGLNKREVSLHSALVRVEIWGGRGGEKPEGTLCKIKHYLDEKTRQEQGKMQRSNIRVWATSGHGDDWSSWVGTCGKTVPLVGELRVGVGGGRGRGGGGGGVGGMGGGAGGGGVN